MTKPTGKPKGRPRLDRLKRTVPSPYSLERALVERLEGAVPKGKRSAFVADAVREKLDRGHPQEGGAE